MLFLKHKISTTTKHIDEDTSLYFYGARYYDPELGRFITADSIVQAPYDPQSLNRYTYARNNPVNLVDPTGRSWKKFWKSFVGAFVGAVITVITGGLGAPFWLAGMAGGFFGGALTGGLEGGWKGALFGGLIGGALGGLGGWGFGIAQAHQMTGPYIVGMLIAGAGVAGATDSWDSFAGGVVGGIAGAVVGTGIVKSQQFQNWKAGEGFRSNRSLLTYKYEREIAMIQALSPDNKDKTIVYGLRGLAKNKSLDPATIGPKHSYTNDGSPWEVGPVKGKIQTSNTVEDLSSWNTHITTQKAITTGVARETTVQVNSWGWQESGAAYEKYWVGQPYYVTNHNSNYATATRIHGANGDVPDDLGWAPQFR